MALFLQTLPGKSLVGILALLVLMGLPSTRDWMLILAAPFLRAFWSMFS